MTQPDKFEELDPSQLRAKLVDAERKYYVNLQVLEEKLARLEAVQALGRLLITCTDPAEALDKLVELSVRDMGVEKAIVIQPSDLGYEIRAIRGYSRRQARELRGHLVPEDEPHMVRVRTSKIPELFEAPDGALATVLELCQMIVCPLRSEDGTSHGFLIVGFSARKIGLFRAFRDLDVPFFEMVASQVGALLQDLALRATFRKFVPRQFLDRLGKDGLGKIRLGQAEFGRVTILFADVRAFATLSETLRPQELLNFLNAYFERMNAPIHENGGFIDKFIGDAIMTLFIDDDPAVAARNAVQASIDMLIALKHYNKERRLEGHAPITIGIGIHSGDAVIGTVGSSDRMDSTVLGDSVNLASRIESLTKRYGAQVLISSQCYRLIEGDATFKCREVDFLKAHGKGKAELVYEVYNGNPPDILDFKSRIDETYHSALVAFHDRDWSQALALFRQCAEIYPADPTTKMYVGRCEDYLRNPPALEWDGIVEIREK